MVKYGSEIPQQKTANGHFCIQMLSIHSVDINRPQVRVLV